MMKSPIILFTIVFVTMAFAQDEKQKSCFRGNDLCSELKEAAKGYFKTIAGAEPSLPKLVRPGSPAGHAKLLKFLDDFQEMFNLTSKYDCKVEACICNAGALQCTPVADKVKTAAAKAQAPECVERSEKAKAFFDQFKTSIAANDHQAILENIKTIREHVVKDIEARDTAGLACVRETLHALRKDLKEKLKNYDIQENCDFCKA